jgi:hypothetical protein
MTKATCLVKLWFYEAFPENYSKEMIYATIRERFKFLGDKLENIIIENPSHENDREEETLVKTPSKKMESEK